MARSIHGIASFFLIMAFVFTGMAASFLVSSAAGFVYLVSSIIAPTAVIVFYCAKCPGKKRCIHVVPGFLACGIDKNATPYTAFEYAVTGLAFAALVVIPQRALIANRPLFFLFWIFACATVLDLYFIVCRSCFNVFCPMKKICANSHS